MCMGVSVDGFECVCGCVSMWVCCAGVCVCCGCGVCFVGVWVGECGRVFFRCIGVFSGCVDV